MQNGPLQNGNGYNFGPNQQMIQQQGIPFDRPGLSGPYVNGPVAPGFYQPENYRPQGNNGLRDPREFASGLPYVTPSVGRYPTSPYMGPRPIIQNVAFQRTLPLQAGAAAANQQPTLPQYTQPPPNIAMQPAAPPQTALGQPIYPQNPSPGIYPAGQCTPNSGLPADGSLGATYAPPTVTPNWNPGMYSPNNSGYRPLFSLGQENYNVVLGRGIVGQPTAYVPGQYLRNFLRYLMP
jgi:hypothetical protein